MRKLIKSEKNKDMIIDCNFLYTVGRVSRAKVLWRCTKRVCNAIGYTVTNYTDNLSSFQLERGHNHACDENSVLRILKTYEMKEYMSSCIGCINPRAAYSHIMRGADIGEVRAVGTYENISRILRSYRNNIINPKPYLYRDVNLSSVITTTHSGENFYQYGPNNYGSNEIFDSVQLFFSFSSIEMLKNNYIWCVDGTFSVVPAPYYQLYTISVLIGNNVYPVVFAILKDKLAITYKKIFEILKNLVGRIEPRIIKSDFETGSINALKFHFPRANISACQFHLGQSLLRKIKEQSIYVVYKTQTVVKKFVKLCVCLAYVTPSEVESTFMEIRNRIDFPIILFDFFDYFYRVYINDNSASFPISLWNCCDILIESAPRTNNAIEGWHSIFKRTFGSCRNSYEMLVFRMKEEEECLRLKYLQNVCGHIFRRKKRYVLMEVNLLRFFNSCTEKHGYNYVDSLANILFY